MTTFGQLTDSVLKQMNGYLRAQDQSTHLTSSITDAATSAVVADTTRVSAGVVEIGDELIYVDSVDATSGTVTIAPYGRGYAGTTAAAHDANVRVVSSPAFPRSTVKDAINEAIDGLSGDLFAVSNTTLTMVAGQSTYGLPATTKGVLSVSVQDYGDSGDWIPVRRWRLDQSANTTDYATGVSITILDNLIAGRSVQVVRVLDLTRLSGEADVLTTVSGLPASAADLVRLGAVKRLAPFMDTQLLQGFTPEAAFAQNSRPQAGGINLARFVEAQYDKRLAEERAKQAAQFPLRSHFIY